jgi:CDP-diacylglycerol--glycerol-3-phosphate 3-phosphatidyltransferase
MPAAPISKQILTPANIVTTVRIALIPVFVFVILAPWPTWIVDNAIAEVFADIKPLIAAIVFALLALADSVDGYLARSRNEVTTLGKFLDPLADKILVAAALLALTDLGTLPVWIALVIIAREFLVSGLRMVASAEGLIIAASPLGKAKTVLQIIAVLLFLLKDMPALWLLSGALKNALQYFSWTVMIAAVALTLLSLADYFYKSAAALGLPLKPVEKPAPGRLSASPATAAGTIAPALADGASAVTGQAAVASVVTGQAVTALATEPLAAGAAAAGTIAPALADEPGALPCADLPAQVIATARAAGLSVGTAESCTGGLIAARLTDVPGASEVFKGGIISYANEVKQERLGVAAATLASYGAVSKETACEMATGALQALGVDVAVSVTGIAGPDGGTPEKPVGTVWIGIAWRGRKGAPVSKATHHLFAGDRAAIREQTVESALDLLRALLKTHCAPPGGACDARSQRCDNVAALR